MGESFRSGNWIAAWHETRRLGPGGPKPADTPGSVALARTSRLAVRSCCELNAGVPESQRQTGEGQALLGQRIDGAIRR